MKINLIIKREFFILLLRTQDNETNKFEVFQYLHN